MMKIRFLENSGILQPQQISVGLYLSVESKFSFQDRINGGDWGAFRAACHAWEVGFISNVRRSPVARRLSVEVAALGISIRTTTRLPDGWQARS